MNTIQVRVVVYRRKEYVLPGKVTATELTRAVEAIERDRGPRNNDDRWHAEVRDAELVLWFPLDEEIEVVPSGGAVGAGATASLPPPWHAAGAGT